MRCFGVCVCARTSAQRLALLQENFHGNLVEKGTLTLLIHLFFSSFFPSFQLRRWQTDVALICHVQALVIWLGCTCFNSFNRLFLFFGTMRIYRYYIPSCFSLHINRLQEYHFLTERTDFQNCRQLPKIHSGPFLMISEPFFRRQYCLCIGAPWKSISKLI